MKLLYERKIGTVNVDVLFKQWGLAGCDAQDIEVDMAAEVILGMNSADERTQQSFVNTLLNTKPGKSFTLISKETNIGVTGIINFSDNDLIYIEVIQAFKDAMFVEKTFSA